MTDRLTRVDAILLRINLLLLLGVAVLPFPTRLLADALGEPASERVFVTLYGLTLLAIRVLLFGMDEYARRRHLYTASDAGGELRTDERKSQPIIIGYVIAILIGLAVPRVTVVLYFALAVYVVVPFRQPARRLFRRRGSEK